MADSYSVSWLTSAFEKELLDKGRQMDRASVAALRDASRAAAAAERKKVRVYKGPNAQSVRSVRKVRKAGGTVGSGVVVAGLLRDAMRPNRVVKKGTEYVAGAGPHGARAHLYAAKIDALDHFVDAGRSAGEARIGIALTEALARVWR